MAWIESHTVLLRHRKVIETSRELRIRRSHLMGHLHALWHATLEQQEDGDLSSWSDEFIAESSDYPGEASQWVRLLQKHGWLNDRKIHDWIDYAGLFLTKKYSTSNRGKLVEIWARHGRVYGSANSKRTESEPTVPYLPHRTEPTRPNLTAVNDRSIDQEKAATALPKGVKSAAMLPGPTMAPAEAMEQKRLLELVWQVKGDYKGLRVLDLPVDYCAWGLGGGLSRLGEEYKRALRARVELKAQEKRR